MAAEFLVTRAFACLGSTPPARSTPSTCAHLYPFARKGLRSAALWLIASSLVSLYWLGPAVLAVNTPIVFGVLVLALLVFLHPLVAVHTAIRAAKEAKLESLRVRIRAEEERLALDQSRRTHGWRTWSPTTGSSSRRASGRSRRRRCCASRSSSMLGLGSWLGAALVERWLERLVG